MSHETLERYEKQSLKHLSSVEGLRYLLSEIY